MKLFYSKGSCALVVRIILKELGLTCQYEAVNLKTKMTETGKDFYAINPKGSVPVLQFKHGDVLTENAVILQFLADDSKSSKLLPPIGDFERYRVLEWLNYITTEIHKTFSCLFNTGMPEAAKEGFFIPSIHGKLSYVNAQLEDKTYLVSEHFTLPDAYLFVMILYAFHFNIDIAAWPHLSSYYTLLKSRLSIKQAMEEEWLSIP